MAGLIRGAGSIGSTLMAPQDYLSDFIQRKLDPNYTGNRNDQRRTDITGGLATLGADTASPEFSRGKMGGEVVGTLGIAPGLGGLISKAAPAVGSAVASGGMTTGLAPTSMAGRAGDMALRTLGGATSGAATAGAVDPESAGTGAAISGALPMVARTAGVLGNAIGRTVRGPEVPQRVADVARMASENGLVIPPSQVHPSLFNRTLEGFSGKITTAQNASARNAEQFRAMVNKDFGLPPETNLTPEILSGIRKQASASYEAIKQTGAMAGDDTFRGALNKIKSTYEGAASDFPELAKPELTKVIDSLDKPVFKASSAIDAIRILRDKADTAYRTGEKATGKAFKEAASAMEDVVERNLERMGSNGQEMLKQFRDARTTIAKTYTAENALNPATGNIEASKLASRVQRGKPTSGGMQDIGNFALTFPKAAQSVERMGSLPQTSPLDWALGGGLSAVLGNPLAMASVLARPAARSMVLSSPVQNGLLRGGAPSILGDEGVQMGLLRLSPYLAVNQ